VIRRKNEKLWFNELKSGEADSEGGSGRVRISMRFWVGICGYLVGFMALFNCFLYF
jgi:hypothetical protein